MLSDGAPSLGSYLGCDGLAQVVWWVDESFIQTKAPNESSFVCIALEKNKNSELLGLCRDAITAPQCECVCVCVCVCLLDVSGGVPGVPGSVPGSAWCAW